MDKSRRYLFDEWAEHYDSSVESQNHPFPFSGYSAVLDEIIKQSNVQPNMQVLDLGVGTGNLARRFVDTGCIVWGVDFSSKMIEKAQKKLPQVKFVLADFLSKWPRILKRHFNCIVSGYVLHEFNLATRIKLLKRLAFNNLLTNGRIVIGDVAFFSTKDRDQAHKKWKDEWDENEYYWAADEIIWSCKKAGLQTEFTQVSICAGVFIFEPTKR